MGLVLDKAECKALYKAECKAFAKPLAQTVKALQTQRRTEQEK